MNLKSSTYSPSVQFFRQTLAPLLLILTCPSVVMAFCYTNLYLDGSLQALWHLVLAKGLGAVLYQIWAPNIFGSATAWKLIGTFAAFELLLMRVLPGRTFEGPITPKGNVPRYRANGLPAFVITLFTFCFASFYLNLFSPTIIYDNFMSLLGALNLFSLIFCFFLLLKGRISPSSSDAGASGNPIFDYYWGVELYPRILGWDVKMFTNCRFGMMGWALILLSFSAKQAQVYGLSDSMMVSVALQLIYIAKFFIWETGYLRSLDIMHDRAGYYICWGCLVWLPGIYTSPTLYLVNHPNQLGFFWSSVIFIVGAVSISINYLADRQRQLVRSRQGECLVWGKTPVLTLARYKTENGELKQNILLASGWWGLSRHFHYIPEIIGALCWTVPALFNHFLPYFYVLFLIILLTDRAFRDDKRCATKYREDWDAYCEKVPYKIIPYLI